MIDIRYLLLVREDKRLQDVNYKTRLVLYALSSRLNERGGCYPSQEQIGKDTNLSVRSVQRGLNEAVECGFLTRDASRSGKSNYYTFPYIDHYAKETGMTRRKVINNPCQVDGGRRESGAGDPCQVDARPLPGRRPTPVHLADEVIPLKGTKEDSLSLREAGVRQVDASPERVTEWDGSTKPETRDHLVTIKRWCDEKGLTPDKKREFLRINNLSHWNQVTQLCPVPDMIDNYIDLWRKNDPEGYKYEMEKRREERRRAEENRLRKQIEDENDSK